MILLLLREANGEKYNFSHLLRLSLLYKQKIVIMQIHKRHRARVYFLTIELIFLKSFQATMSLAPLLQMSFLIALKVGCPAPKILLPFTQKVIAAECSSIPYTLCACL